MSRLPINTPDSSIVSEPNLSDIAHSSAPLDPDRALSAIESTGAGKVLVPTDSQLQAKCRFWARTVGAPADLTVDQIATYAGTSSVRKWWSTPGFQDWFLNRDDARERILFLYIKILDQAQSLIANGDINANALLNLVKSIQLIEERLYPKVEDGENLEDFEKMSESELVALIEAKGIRVHQVLQIEPEDTHSAPPTSAGESGAKTKTKSKK